MNAERLAEIRYLNEVVETDDRTELLAYVDELTRQLDDARTKAIDAGIFTSDEGRIKFCHLDGEEYTGDRCGLCAVAS